ncbi:MAG: hypothetical protein V7676_05290 [Parasphingorhabdus sp.]|uniref:hypothetical protein n=1 Tax=Parasphingorhabdus sp. TaxID=2709688 RepID=UPI0030010014
MQDEGQASVATPKRRRRDTGVLLLEQIQRIVGLDFTVSMVRERPWASVTFSGTRHKVQIKRLAQTRSPAMTSWSRKIADHEFTLPGHFVADLLVVDETRQCNSFTLEILTIIDPVAPARARI